VVKRLNGVSFLPKTPGCMAFPSTPRRHEAWRFHLCPDAMKLGVSTFHVSWPAGYGLRSKRQELWRLLCNPNAIDVGIDVGVTEKGQICNSFQNEVNLWLSLAKRLEQKFCPPPMRTSINQYWTCPKHICSYSFLSLAHIHAPCRRGCRRGSAWFRNARRVIKYITFF
jgi:hypothetical protein